LKKYFLFLLLTFQFYSCLAQENNPDTTLLIVGTFNLKNNLVRDIHVKLYVDDRLVDSMIVEGNQAFGFYLKRNLVYSVDVFKDGFIKKTIGVSTKLPDDVKTKPFFTFPFQVPLDRSGYEDKLVKYASDYPTAVIYYNEEIGKFDYGIDSARIKKKKNK
jgi:hypothetical protein